MNRLFFDFPRNPFVAVLRVGLHGVDDGSEEGEAAYAIHEKFVDVFHFCAKGEVDVPESDCGECHHPEVKQIDM